MSLTADLDQARDFVTSESAFTSLVLVGFRTSRYFLIIVGLF